MGEMSNWIQILGGLQTLTKQRLRSIRLVFILRPFKDHLTTYDMASPSIEAVLKTTHASNYYQLLNTKLERRQTNLLVKFVLL